MSLIFPYVTQPTATPIWSLSGRQVRPRPLIFVAVIGPTGVGVEKGLIDTGADDTVFSELIATDIGVDLAHAPTRTAAGVGSTAVAAVKYAEVTLRISDGHENREWTARVGFTSSPLHRPLLGFAGFLQFFTATFHGDREQVELAVNASFQGK